MSVNKVKLDVRDPEMAGNSKKVVLISYNDFNKIVSIPQKQNQPDLEYLTQQCKKLFKFGVNVNLDIVFQKFDPEWNTLVDLTEDYILSNKDKLNMVVQPMLNDSIKSQPCSSKDLEVGCNFMYCYQRLNLEFSV